jgi:hypothetical protein
MNTTTPATITDQLTDLTPAAAWSRRVRRIGGFIQAAFAARVTAGIAPRPAGPQARRIERSVTIATLAELAAAFVLPVIVTAAGQPGWVLPSIVITIGPLLLWLDHVVSIPRYRLVGWALTAGPVVLVAVLSGPALAITTGIAAGVLLPGTAVAGFRDLARIGTARRQAA